MTEVDDLLQEVAGLSSRSLNINDARGLVIASGLGWKMAEPDLEFNGAEDLANILFLTSQATGLLMN